MPSVSRSVSEAGGSPRFVVIGNADRRVALFQDALVRQGLLPAQVVLYADLLAGRVHLAQIVQPGDVVRIESPGKNWEVEQALLRVGAEDAAGEEWERLPASAVNALAFDRGEIVCSRQWFLGFCRTLDVIKAQLGACPPHRMVNAPGDIAVLFDKPACQARLAVAGVCVPRTLGVVRSYDDLVARLAGAGWGRAFVKLAHGSSASGVVAYQAGAGRRRRATTTTELVRTNGTVRLFNSRRIRIYENESEIAELVNALCRHRMYAEQWLPKAGLSGKTFDLRVVVIAGRARHVVARLSRTPLTNLHLLNERADGALAQKRLGDAAWAALHATCSRAATAFPRSLYAGLDVAVAPDFRQHAVLEANAFGDLLPGVCDNGQNTYEAEIAAISAGERA